jgi:hypothetical protein
VLRRALRASMAALVGATALITIVAGPAVAEPGDPPIGTICDENGHCDVQSGTPSDPGNGNGGNSGGGGDGGGGPVECFYDGVQYPCTQDGWGYFNESDGCYYVLESPQPPAGDEAWEGHEPGDGAVYRQRCFGSMMGFLVWRAAPPPGQPSTITPEQLAARAIRAIPMAVPAIGMAPRTGGAGLVGLPVWMWVSNTPAAWGPVERTASVPGLAVTARAEVGQAIWTMGDGGTVTCTTPGTPYRKEFGLRESECGYRYLKVGTYPISVTTTWVINWWVVGGGATGDASVTRQAATEITIEELQVVRS